MDYVNVIILENGDMEEGRNPVFTFYSLKEMHKFVDMCIENGHSVEILPVKEKEND
jgi:hypothetical protein